MNDNFYAELDADEITKRATDDFVRMVPATPETLEQCAVGCGFESAMEYVEMAGLKSIESLLSKIDFVMSGIGWEIGAPENFESAPLLDGNEIPWADDKLYSCSTFVQCDIYIDFVNVPMHKAADGSYWLNTGLTS